MLPRTCIRWRSISQAAVVVFPISSTTLIRSLVSSSSAPTKTKHATSTGANNGISLTSHRHISCSRTHLLAPKASNEFITLSKQTGFRTIENTQAFLAQLTEQQKLVLFNTLNLELLKQKYQDELGHYLTKLGRPTSTHHDPTGTFCEVSPNWLQNKLDEVKGVPASGKVIWAVGVKNAIPFVGFGFLDNLIMILAGDYIDTTIGTSLAISTMAAAALGNTISDVAGIASAWYVERVAEKIGIHQPSLTAFQMASWQIRWVTNIGRALGVTIGCLLGMIPLFFLNTKSDDAAADSKSEPGAAAADTEKGTSHSKK